MTSVGFYFPLSAAFLFLAWLVVQRHRFYRGLLADDANSTRFHAIDGLRGFLALGVFFHHAMCSFYYYKLGHWDDPPSRFYTLTGEVGVALFFMITAFLFWTKGTGVKEFDARAFYRSRVKRLVPMYFFSVFTVLAIVVISAGPHIRVGYTEFVRQIASWLAFGFVKPLPDIDGVVDSFRLNAAYWTLAYEWSFYVALPFCLLFARSWRFSLLIVLAGVFGAWLFHMAVVWNFIFGALTALVIRSGFMENSFKAMPFGLVPLSVLVLLFTQFGTAYGLQQSVLMFIVFVFVAFGNNIFGILTSRPARLLGAVSYSIYLMHMPVLYAILEITNRFKPIESFRPLEYWSLVCACGFTLIGVSILTYQFVEYPFWRGRWR